MVPVTPLGVGTPMAAWCLCRPVVRAAAEAAERRAGGEDVGEEGWEAVRMVLTGLLPECRAAMELGERERRRLEGEVTKAVVEAQEIVVSMLREYREVTRRARAAKQEALDSWWAAERTRRRHRRELHAKVRKGLEGMAAQRRLERKRRLDSLLDAVAGAQAAATEEERRKTQRGGAEVARTRAGGVHRLGTGLYTSDGTGTKRGTPWGWEAGDTRRICQSGVGELGGRPSMGFACITGFHRSARGSGHANLSQRCRYKV